MTARRHTRALRKRYGHAEGDVTPVIFRVWPKNKGGDVIALFPTLPEDRMGYECSSYQHVGQHGAADCNGVIRVTRAASPEEYAPLKRELEGIGYKLKVYARASRSMNDKRMKEARA